ncbi:MAG: Hsp20/alpha crystallin family protein [Anaerolineales bacterium]|jgi:HSP20 family protein
MKEIEYQWVSPQESESKKPKFVLATDYEGWTSRVHIWQPPTDLFENEDAYIVRVEVAGMREAEFVISLEKRLLLISGVRTLPENAGAYHRLEIHSGEFVSGVELPGPVEYDRIEALYTDGFLRIQLPKANPRQIDIKS